MIRIYISSVSGNYVIDPDGAGGLVPFKFHCDMSDKNGAGGTQVDGCDPVGCYSRDIHYIGVSKPLYS